MSEILVRDKSIEFDSTGDDTDTLFTKANGYWYGSPNQSRDREGALRLAGRSAPFTVAALMKLEYSHFSTTLAFG